MSGIALMHDAALAAIREGRLEEAERVIASSLERERDTIRTLRDLSFAIEPLVLRDRGFAAAVDALAEQVESSYRIAVSADVRAGERAGRKGAGRALPADPRGREPGRAAAPRPDRDQRRSQAATATRPRSRTTAWASGGAAGSTSSTSAYASSMGA